MSDSMDLVDIQNLPFEVIKQGRQLRESLNEIQTARLQSVYARLQGAPFLIPFEQFERGFLSDVNPDRELAVWEAIATAIERSAPKGNELAEVSRLALWLSTHKEQPNPKAWTLSRRVIDRVQQAWQAAKQDAGIDDTLIRVQRD